MFINITVPPEILKAVDPCNTPPRSHIARSTEARSHGQFANWKPEPRRSVPKIANLGRKQRQLAERGIVLEKSRLDRKPHAMPRLLSAILILVLATTGCLAQGYGSSHDHERSSLNDQTTNRVVRLLERGLRQCQALNSVYRYDCYRQNYRAAGRRLTGNRAYAPALQALRNVEATLTDVLSSDADPGVQPFRRRGKSFSAISESAIPSSRAAFSAALDEAATELLRSANPGNNHFARIASVMDSEKVFLRSMLTPASPPRTRRI